MGRALAGVSLGALARPRPAAWEPLPAAETPAWAAMLSAAPWLRAAPVASDPSTELSAIAVTADVDEARRWLAVRTSGGWAVSDPLEPREAQGMTSWDRVETGARLLGAPDAIVARASAYGAGAGTARLVVLRRDGDRLAEQGHLPLGAVRTWRSDQVPSEPVFEPLRNSDPAAPPSLVAWRVLHEVAPGGAAGCLRVTRVRAELARVAFDFQPIARRRPVALAPEAAPASLRFETLADARGLRRLTADGLVPVMSCDAAP